MSRRRFMGEVKDKNTVSLLHCDDNTGIDNRGFATVQNKSLSTVAGKFGNANTGYVKYQPNQWRDLMLNGDYTIDFWVYPRTTSSNEWQVVLYLGGNSVGTANIRMQVDHTQNKIIFFISQGSGWIANNAAVAISMSKWQHIAWVYSKATKNLMLFVDGVKKWSINYNPTSAPGSMYYIGVGWENKLADNSYRDEIRFSNVARWTTNFTPPTNPYN